MINGRKCPSCDGEGGALISRTNRGVDMRNLEAIQEYFVGLRPEQVFFDYIRCKFCGLAYCSDYFNFDELSILYSHMPPNLVGDEIDVVDKTHYGYARTIIKRCKKVKKKTFKTLLELGADLGLVTGPVVKALKIDSGTLVEPNLDVRSQLLESVNREPGFAVVSDLNQAELEKRFDLVIAIHVIDHLLDPKETLKRVYLQMNEYGKIFIVVHNQRSLLAGLLKSKWPPYCLQHPQVFDKSTIRRALQDVGFRNVKITRTTNYVGLSNGLNSFLSILKLPNAWTNILPNIAIPFKYGNILVEAEKIN